MNRRTRVSRAAGVVLGAALLVGGAVLMTAPPVVPEAQAAGEGDLPIDESLQTPGSIAKLTLTGKGAKPSDSFSLTGWEPQLMNVEWANTNVNHSDGTFGCKDYNTNGSKCLAATGTKDGQWLTLTTDNTNSVSGSGGNPENNPNNGRGTAGTATWSAPIESKRGVVVEYDQRLYRTNNGQQNGSGGSAGAGDGIAVYLADGASTPAPGGFGAGLGYSSVASTGLNWCPAEPGVPAGYLGVGFDVFGNYQKAENNAPNAAATRPMSVSGGKQDSRVVQSIGLRGSGTVVGPQNCSATGDGSFASLQKAYGQTDLSPAIPWVPYPGFTTVFQVKWDSGDTAASYTGEYRAAGSTTWIDVPVAEAPASAIPSDFTDSRGYVMFQIPSDVNPFDFQYKRGSDTRTFSNLTSGASVSLGNPPDYTTLGQSKLGGYRWLAGTNANGAGGNLDNNFTNDQTGTADMYRRVRVSFTPTADGTRDVVVSMTGALSVSNDVCRDTDGNEVAGGANATTASCAAAGGVWGNADPDNLSFTDYFTYSLGTGSFQAEAPETFWLGFSASTGWAVNYHQIRNLTVRGVYEADLAVHKKVSFLAGQAPGGGAPEVPSDIAWKAQDTGTAGQYIAYQVQAMNGGPADMEEGFPGTLTDGLGSVPFKDASAVTWTATGEYGAKVCAPSDWTPGSGTEGTCSNWADTATGTGPLAGTNTLHWYSPSRTVIGEPTATEPVVSVVFVGQVRDNVSNDASGIKLNTWYPNTATVASSTFGGPPDKSPDNNTDSARIRIAPGLRVDKVWKVNGTSYADGTQPDGISTSLTLTSTPAVTTGTPQFGVAYPLGLDEDGTALVPSSVTVNEGTITVPSGCTVTSRTVTKANAATPNVDLGSGYNMTLDMAVPVNTVEITNELTCSTLTLAKTVDNTFAGTGDFAGSTPVDWKLTAMPGTGPAVIDGVPSVGSGDTMSTDTVTVPAGNYTLSEAWAYPNPDDEDAPEDTPANISAAYTQKILGCTGGTLAGDVVTVPSGTAVTCTFENAAKPGSATWAKVDDSAAEKPLAGSEWELKGPDASTTMTLTQTACTGSPAAPGAPYCTYTAVGKFKVDNLPWGEYELTETKAPAGYKISEDSPWEFWIGSEDADDKNVLEWDGGNIVNEPMDGPTLPLTGGASSFMYFVLGLSLVGAAVGAEMIRRKKRGSGARVA